MLKTKAEIYAELRRLQDELRALQKVYEAKGMILLRMWEELSRKEKDDARTRTCAEETAST